MHSGGAQECAQRSQPAQSELFGLAVKIVRCKYLYICLGSRLVCTFAKALLPPSAPRVGGTLGASSAQTCF